MSDIKKDGGPAFPIEDARGNIYSGMSLRDCFAGMALMGIAAATNENNGYGSTYVDPQGNETCHSWSYPIKNGHEDYSGRKIQHKILRTIEQNEAKNAYERADAMLAEREK